MLRTNLGVMAGLLEPMVHPRMHDALRKDRVPMCLTCLGPTDSETIVEGYRVEEDGRTRASGTFAKVLVKCHGAEELVTLDFGTAEWDIYDIGTRLARRRFFDPLASHEDAGREVVAAGLAPANDVDTSGIVLASERAANDTIVKVSGE